MKTLSKKLTDETFVETCLCLGWSSQNERDSDITCHSGGASIAYDLELYAPYI